MFGKKDTTLIKIEKTKSGKFCKMLGKTFYMATESIAFVEYSENSGAFLVGFEDTVGVGHELDLPAMKRLKKVMDRMIESMENPVEGPKKTSKENA